MAKILCVEDESLLLDDIAEVLALSGHQVFKASDGNKGLQMILHLKPDLVVSDITMPGLTGTDLVREIRNNHPEHAEMPIVLLSALADKTAIMQGLDYGADDYLTKPFDHEILAQKVNSLLRQVERIKRMNEAKLAQLVESLSLRNENIETESPKAPASPPTSAAAKMPIVHKAEIKKPGSLEELEKKHGMIPSEDLAWRAQGATRKIYGATLNIKNVNSNETCKKQSVIGWVAQAASDFMKQLFADNGAVAVNKNGGIFVCYPDADENTAVSRTQEINSRVVRDLKDRNIPKPFSDEDILELSIVAEAPFQTEISEKALKNKKDFASALQQHIDATVPKIGTSDDLMKLINEVRCELVLHKLINQKGQVLPIVFFNFNKVVREYISIGFTQFNSRELADAGYKIDCLFLQLLKDSISFLTPNDIVMTDVHYATLITPEFQRLFIPKIKDFAKGTRVKLLLNIRGVTKAAKSQAFQEVLKPLSLAAKGCTIQIAPEEFEGFISSRLPVSGLVCSYLQTNWDAFSPDLVRRAKAALSNARIPLIVRGVPTQELANKLYKLGFDGCGIDEM